MTDKSPLMNIKKKEDGNKKKDREGKKGGN
jgi:hypothetical protein